jgi:hypothetical protein
MEALERRDDVLTLVLQWLEPRDLVRGASAMRHGPCELMMRWMPARRVGDKLSRVARA